MALGIMVVPAHAGIVTFGTGSNSFAMELVSIGNPGNANDAAGVCAAFLASLRAFGGGSHILFTSYGA